jgi:kojibiose phosphorylase
VRWVLRELAAPRAIAPEDMLVGGDEFGPVAGFPGSDDKMVVPEARGAVLVSVGPEPGGAPPPVIHLGGGPDRFLDLLAAQAARHLVRLPATPTRDLTWILVESPFVPSREHEIESLFAVANGHVGSRGSLDEGSPLSAPATYVAGVFEAAPGSTMPQLLALPDWAHLEAAIDGKPMTMSEGEVLLHRRVLDMRQGILWREWRHRDEEGRVSNTHALRFASLADRHILAQSIALTPENYAGMLLVRGTPPAVTTLETSRGVKLAFAVSSVVEGPSTVLNLPADFAIPVHVGYTYRLDRVLDVETARDGASPPEIATRHLHEVLAREGMDGIVEAHRRAWDEVWQRSDVRVDGDPDAQRALRFAIYHLVSAAEPDDDHASIGARALTGPGYGGHVFWDTDVYVLPFLTFTWPAAARAALMYRCHTLPAARAKARSLGYRGALYAWESADTGEETTPTMFVDPDGEVVPVFSGTREQHISADVAWGAWSYWQATGDEAFLRDAGAEMVLETARFWASRARRGDDGAYHIAGVEGPDEYHELVDDDAYTNGMAQWNLERGAEVARTLARRWPEAWRALSTRLEVAPDEPDQWLEIAARMYTGLDPATGLIEEFRGYYGLERLDLTPYARRRTPMTVLLGRERIARSQIVKQPDVVMLLHLLWDRFPAAVREANFRFYDARTDHGSSLSPPVHAAVAARLGDVALAERYFRQTAAIDLDNDMGNAASGVHIAALGGLWQAAVLGFAGLETGPRGPTLRPHLPPSWRWLSFPITWRGERHDLCATHGATAAPIVRAGAEAS